MFNMDYKESMEKMLPGAFRIVTNAEAFTGEAYAILAVNGDVVFGAGCVVEDGDPPAEDDVISHESVRFGAFTTIVIKTGKAYVYYKSES